MATINNPRQIRAEDFGDDLQQPMSQLGSTINPFMQEIFEIFTVSPLS